MLGLHHHQYSEGIEPIVEAIGDLCGETLLHLGPTRESLYESGQLRQTGDPPLGHVRHVCLAVEGDEVVLAHRVERDLAHHHDLLVVLFSEEGVDHLPRIEMDPSKYLLVETGDPGWGLHKSFPERVFAEGFDDLPHRLFDSAGVDGGHG